MNSSIEIFFLSAHGAIYIYVLMLVYKKFVRPYLIDQQYQEDTLTRELQQKLSHVQSLMQRFKQRVDYLTKLFKKISYQQAEAHEAQTKLEEYLVQEQVRIQEYYAAQQQIITKHRQLQQLYHDTAPEIIQHVRSELVRFSQDEGKQYLEHVIRRLKQESQENNKA